jgi:hydroxymethylbilane synthase
MGGCSTPIGALAVVQDDTVHLKGNILSVNGKQKIDIEKTAAFNEATGLGKQAGEEILNKGAAAIVEQIRNAR